MLRMPTMKKRIRNIRIKNCKKNLNVFNAHWLENGTYINEQINHYAPTAYSLAQFKYIRFEHFSDLIDDMRIRIRNTDISIRRASAAGINLTMIQKTFPHEIHPIILWVNCENYAKIFRLYPDARKTSLYITASIVSV